MTATARRARSRGRTTTGGTAVEAQEAHEVGDTIAESAHGESSFRRGAAIVLGVIAMLLAIASLLGEAAMKETINFNILASDTYAFYQAKNERQTATQLAADQLEALAAAHPDWSASARANLDKTLADYRNTVAYYESDPKGGQGKKELLAKARVYEEKRDHAQHQDINYDYARALFQIAIVLGSVSIVALSRLLLWLGCGLAAVATLLTLNGFLLLMPLPFD
jgi:Domain of unknown function (DUF4337)